MDGLDWTGRSETLAAPSVPSAGFVLLDALPVHSLLVAELLVSQMSWTFWRALS